MTFNLQHGKVLSIAFCSRFLISNGFLPRKSLDSHYYLGINNSKIVNHFHFKNVLPKKLCSGIVYSFKCNSCKIIYYGKTKRHFYIRAAEHMGISHLTNKRLKNVKQSAISDHLLTCDCNINFDDFTILSKDSNNINLLIKESFLISRDKRIKTVKSFPLELFE